MNKCVGRLIAVIGFWMLLLLQANAFTPPESPELKSGRLEFVLLEAVAGDPHVGVKVTLLAAYPDARPISAQSDSKGSVSLQVPEGSYVMEVNDAVIGLMRVSPHSQWKACQIILPKDHPDPPAGCPVLRPEEKDGGLVLIAEQIATPPPAKKEAVELSAESLKKMKLNDFLQRGLLQDGLQRYAKPAENADHFSLAMLQALDGFQKFVTGINRFNYRDDLTRNLPSHSFLNMIKPRHRSGRGEQATPEKIATLFFDLRAAMRRANNSAAAIDGAEFRVEVNLSRLRLEPDGSETTIKVLAHALRPILDFSDLDDPDAGEIVVRFDSADAKWLQGYTHLIGGVLDLILAYDWRPAWDHTAHLLFTHYHPEPPIVSVGDTIIDNQQALFCDAIAALHAMRLKLADRSGVQRARDEIKAMAACSRISWQRIMKETDNDLEWIPSPAQTGPNGARIEQEEVDAWMRVLDELDAVLSGRKLLPHWRMLPDRGVNLDKLAANPPQLDLVMLIQGSALVPYVEKGAVSSRDEWRELTESFDDGFWRFFLWVN